MRLALSTRTPLKKTRSLCPVCKRELDAEVFESRGEVFLDKRCEAHGRFEVKLSSDRRFYYDSVGAGGSCCEGGACGPASSDLTLPLIERAATCIALIELVESCNLKCPTCYADSPHHEGDAVKSLSLEEVEQRVASLIARKGPIDVLQLSGGEPTIHPRFFDVLGSLLANRNVRYMLLNTNGVRLANEPEFARRLGELRRAYGRFELYLQFDGVGAGGQDALRGGDLRRVRERAIERAAGEGVPVTLAMTVTDENLAGLGETIRFGLARRAIRGITLQPVFGSGRAPEGVKGLVTLGNKAPPRLNVADILRALVTQGEGLLCEADFTPLPCGDPNCHTIGYVLRRGDVYIPASKLVDFRELQGFLKDRVRFTMEDLARCGCESEPLGETLRAFELGPDAVFRIFIKPFMDAWTYDQDRIDRCCVHVLGEGGKLDSFCRHYALRD